MNIPKDFERALHRKAAIELETQAGKTPRLVSDNGAASWSLDGFSARAAFLFADTLLEQYGYTLMSAPDSKQTDESARRSTTIACWRASDP